MAKQHNQNPDSKPQNRQQPKTDSRSQKGQSIPRPSSKLTNKPNK